MARIIHLRQIRDASGCLTPFDKADLPFPLRRVWLLHDIPAQAQRGGHAHHTLEEIIVAVSGSVEIATFDRFGPHRFRLTHPSEGLYVGAREWRRLHGFSSNATVLVLANSEYDEADYIHDFEAFRASLPPIGEGYFERRARGRALWEVDK